MPRPFVLVSLALVCGLAGLGCRAKPSSQGAAAALQASAAAAEALPALKLTEESQNLLLTWIGEDGDFHVAEAIDKVPPDRRSRVRVVQTDQADGTGASVYVADLTVKREDGSYAVSTLPRNEWEKLGADLRKTRMEALAPGAKAAPADPAVADPGHADGPGSAPPGGAEPNLQDPGAITANGAVTAIVYGADWCKPCHDAERYLKSLGVSVTKKNIEESRAAQAEMQQKLARANRSGSSIPVIDVMGRIFVGYSPGSLRQAVEAARHGNAPKHG